MIETVLKKEGMVVDTSVLGEDGLEIGKLYDYDIIILDLVLPDMDGYEVLKRLRDAKIATPVLILSGLSGTDKKVKGLSTGADDYLTKPFDKAVDTDIVIGNDFDLSFVFCQIRARFVKQDFKIRRAVASIQNQAASQSFIVVNGSSEQTCAPSGCSGNNSFANAPRRRFRSGTFRADNCVLP